MKRCPHCKRVLPEDVEVMGFSVICPYCKKVDHNYENEEEKSNNEQNPGQREY